jgi:hypothetical protein
MQGGVALFVISGVPGGWTAWAVACARNEVGAWRRPCMVPPGPGGPEGRLQDARPERAGVDVRVAILHRLHLGRPVVTGF